MLVEEFNIINENQYILDTSVFFRVLNRAREEETGK